MDNKIFINILRSKPERFRVDEVLTMIDEELEKPEDEIEWLFVDICFNALSEANDEDYVYLP